MKKETLCMFCQKPILEHEENHLIANTSVDIPVSHLLGCNECAKKATESKHNNVSMGVKK